jgi:hypothetical protein
MAELVHAAATVNTTGAAKGSPVASPGDRLPEILGAAVELQFNAERLKNQALTLLDDLKGLVEGRRAADGDFDAALDDAFDSASWAHRACENVAGEFDALMNYLDDAVEAFRDTDND